MAALWLLAIVLLVLGIVALVKYLRGRSRVTSKARGMLLIASIGAAVSLVAAGRFMLGQHSRTAEVASGRQVYAEHCAACHGADLVNRPSFSGG